MGQVHANPYKLFLKARKPKSKSHHHPRKDKAAPQPQLQPPPTTEKIMYRGGSPPVFDVPEFPTLRRVKPLPKRRKTSASPTASDATSNNANAAAVVDILGPDATAEELLAHAETLSARMALQSYYVPILGGVQDFLAGTAKPGGASPNLDSLEFGVHLAAAAAAAAAAGVGLGLGGGRGVDEDDERGDGDYIDHLQQPGNTKKRKVPANIGNRGGLDGEEAGGGREEMERGIPTGRTEGGGGGSESATEAYRPTAGQLGMLGQKRGKLAAVTLAGLQHKEMLKSRKRQLAAVLGALSHGDTLALDQALSANYPFVPGGRFDDVKNMEIPVRLSKRTTVRLARAMRIKRVPRHPDAIPLPASEFTFVCPSASEWWRFLPSYFLVLVDLFFFPLCRLFSPLFSHLFPFLRELALINAHLHVLQTSYLDSFHRSRRSPYRHQGGSHDAAQSFRGGIGTASSQGS
jgi:hypothetical protein